MSRLVVIAPLRPGGDARARELLDQGPPFDLADSSFDSQEVVFVFEGTKAGETLNLTAEDPRLWHAAKAWADCLDGRPRIARSAFSWKRDSASG
jgi:hypothetical protein